MDLSAALEAALKAALLPPALMLLVYLGGVLLRRRFPRWGRMARHGAVLLLYVMSTGSGAWLLARPIEALEPVLPPGPVAQAKAVVVLTAGRIKHSPEFGGRATPDLVALGRMTYAAHLVRGTGLPLLVTGGLLSKAPDDEALALGMRRVFEQDFGVPVRWIETASRTTEENARYSAAILKQAGIGHVVLVTTALHMHRARRAFERAGIIVTPAPTGFVASAPFELDLLEPTMENLRRSHYAWYEMLGLARDRLLGGRP